MLSFLFTWLLWSISPSCPVSFTAQDWVTAASGPSQKAPPCGRPEAWAGLGSMVRKKVDRWASLSPLVPGKPHSSLGPCSQGHPQSIGLSVRRTLLAMKFVPDIYSFLCPRWVLRDFLITPVLELEEGKIEYFLIKHGCENLAVRLLTIGNLTN